MGISFQGQIRSIWTLTDSLSTVGRFPATPFLSSHAQIKTYDGKVAIRALNAQNGGNMEIPFGLHILESEAKLYPWNFSFLIFVFLRGTYFSIFRFLAQKSGTKKPEISEFLLGGWRLLNRFSFYIRL